MFHDHKFVLKSNNSLNLKSNPYNLVSNGLFVRDLVLTKALERPLACAHRTMERALIGAGNTIRQMSGPETKPKFTTCCGDKLLDLTSPIARMTSNRGASKVTD